ncbi:MAG: hypothetical protein GTO54_00065 [Nitrososphaeria archaeon]|nr:hypothetical protein [Nitrososphaeria archaeon]
MSYESGLLCFTFDGDVNLSQIRSSPLVIHGQSDVDSSDFDDSILSTRYYSGFSLISSKTTITAGTSGNVVIDLDDQDSLVWYSESTSLIDNSNTLVVPDSNTLDTTPQATGVVTNSTASDINIFAYEAVADYAGTFASTAAINITAGTHLLDDFSIVTQVYEVSGADYIQVTPDSITVDQVTRDVDITFSNTGTYRVFLKQVPIENVATGTVAAFSSNSVTISSLTGDFPYFVIFLDDGTSDLQVVEPDTITINAVTNEAQVTFTNNSPVGANFSIYYDYADVQVNKICVTPHVAHGDVETTDVSLSVWGIKQEEAYVGATGSRPGWVNHVDAYRSPAGAYMVAGLGGNLFREAQRTEAVNITDTYGNVFNIPSLYPDLRARLQNQLNVGPTFWQSTDSPARTRGYITADNLVGTHRAAVESIIWQSGTTVRYTLSMKNHNSVAGTGDIIETTDGFEDELIVENTNYSQFNGTFKITAHGSAGADLYYFDVTNSAVTDGDFDVTGDSAGNARIETDNMLLTLNGEFLVDDELQSDFFDGTQILKIVGTDSAGTTIKVTGFTKNNNFPAGLRLTGLRTSNIVPLRTAASTANDSVLNFVRGDMVKYTDYERQFEVLHINALDDNTVTISVTSGVATVTLSGGETTTGLAVGQQVLFVRAGVHSGVQTITAITDTDKFTFATTETAAGPAGSTLKGKTLQIDEAVQFQDAVENTKTIAVERRWIPIELPVSSESSTLTPIRRITYFDSNSFTSQAFIRSTMVSNNMYFTDGDGAVHKYDGGNIYRAGLFRWQPHLFVTTDSDPADRSGVIAFEGNDVLVDTFVGAVFTVDSGDESRFSVGDVVRHKFDGTEYTIVALEDTKITVNKAITADLVSTTVADGSGAANQINLTDATGFFIGADIVNTNDNEHYQITNLVGTLATLDRNFVGSKNGQPISLLVRLQKRNLFGYYFRLNAVDANNNRLASAVAGKDDFVVELFESSQVRLRLVGMPAWDIYDYDKLEVEIYRTTAEDTNRTTFYHIATIPMDFTENYGYIDFTDTKSDNILVTERFDDTSEGILTNLSNQLAGEIGQQFNEPMRAKYVTSAGNRLILANLKDYPELSIQLYDSGPRIDIDALDGDIWQLRRDSTSSATGTDRSTTPDVFIESTLQLELTKNSQAATVSSINGGSDFTISGVSNQWVYLFHDDQTDQDGTEFCGWWYAGASGVVSWANTPSAATGNTPTRAAVASGTALPVFLGIDANYSMANGNLVEEVVITGASGSQFTVDDGDEAFFAVDDEIIHSDDRTRYTVTSTGTGQVNVTPAITGGTTGRLITSATAPYQQVAVRRMANAINAAMRYSTDPWITAAAGNEFSAGQLLLRSPKVLSTTPEIVLPTFSGFNIFVNNIKRGSTVVLGDPEQEVAVSAKTNTYPSRLMASSPSYPEVFHNSRTISDFESLSAVDVNSADGQEITGIIPFFGDSAFGSAQKGSVIVVFKENSIYLVNLAASERVQKVESQGLGCTAPYSIASTRDGIMFANESGIFRLTRDLRIEYIGQKVERIWQDGEVNLQQLSLAQGTHYALGRQYKLSVPTASASVNSNVMVYNHTREYRGKGFGSWTRYDNHAATGWANLQTNAYFGAANGMVFRLRNEGTETDYRDRASAYTMEATMRAMDFGDSGRRKTVSKVVMQFRVADDQTATIMSSAPDLGKDFTAMDTFEVDQDAVSDNLSDEQGDKVKTISFSPNRRKLVFFQLKLKNTAKDEIVEVAGVDLRIAGLTDEGITQAANTRESEG